MPDSEMSAILAALKERRNQFSDTPSLLPHLHRRIRLAAMEKVSLRQVLRRRLSEWSERILNLNDLNVLNVQGALGYAAAAILVVSVVFTGLRQGARGENEAPLLTLNTPKAEVNEVNYAMSALGEGGTAPTLSLDNRIDQIVTGNNSSNSGSSNAKTAAPRYVMTSASATGAAGTYDTLVAF